MIRKLKRRFYARWQYTRGTLWVMRPNGTTKFGICGHGHPVLLTS